MRVNCNSLLRSKGIFQETRIVKFFNMNVLEYNAEGVFAEIFFAERNFRQAEFSPTDFSAVGFFAERKFHRKIPKN